MLTVDFNRLDIKSGTRVLDVGCGPGRHSWEAYSLKGVNVVAVDMAQNTVRFARHMLLSMNEKGLGGGGSIYATVANATKMPFFDSSFGLVICSEVLEHIPDDRAALGEFARVLEPDGTLVISVPLYFPERICWALSGKYREMAGGHVRIYTKKRLARIFSQAGFVCEASCKAHALHSPLWWLKCLAAEKQKTAFLAQGYEKFINWHEKNRPAPSVFVEKLLAPVMAKSIVYYLKKEEKNEAQHAA